MDIQLDFEPAHPLHQIPSPTINIESPGPSVNTADLKNLLTLNGFPESDLETELKRLRSVDEYHYVLLLLFIYFATMLTLSFFLVESCSLPKFSCLLVPS